MNEIEILKLENKRVRERCNELQEIEKAYEASKIQSEEAIDQVSKLQNEIADLYKAKKDIEKTKHKMEAKLEQCLKLKSTFIEKEKYFKKSEETFNNLLKERDFSVQNLNSEIEKLKKQNTELFKKQSEQQKILQKELLKFQKENAQLLTENKEFNVCLANADKEVQKLTRVNEELQKNIDLKSGLQESIDDLAKTRQESTNEIEDLNKELSNKTNDIVVLMKQNKELREEHKSLKNDIIKLLKENEELLNKNIQLEDDIKTANINMEDAQHYNKTLTEKNEEQLENILNLKDCVNNLENSLDQTRAERDNLSNIKSQLEIDVDNLQKENLEVKNKCSLVTDQLVHTLEDKHQLKKEIDYMDASNNENYGDLELELKSAVKRISTISNKVIEEIQRANQRIGEEFLKVNLQDTV